MNCHKCGGTLEDTITDLPFKVSCASIVIIKKLPVIQCRNCDEYSLPDEVMEKVASLLQGVDKEAELEILTYAA